jgi:signal transduction histidine kinase
MPVEGNHLPLPHHQTGTGSQECRPKNPSQQLDWNAIIRHDMRNMVSVLRLRLHILKKTQSADGDQLSAFATGIDHLAALLEQWRQLDLNVTEAAVADSEETFDIGELIARILDTYQPLVHIQGQKLVYRAAARALLITGVKLQYARLIENLISNACKYTLPGGTIWVDVRNQKTGLNIMVADSGIGIPAKDLMHIFKPYYRVSTAETNHINGTGLGLAIVKNIVNDLDGEIAVRSKVGAGTTFKIRLPVCGGKNNGK